MPPLDPYAAGAPGAAGPARRLFAVTPSDTVDLPYVTTGLYVGGAGDVAVRELGTASPVVFKAVPAGTVLPICIDRVRATGTSASNLVGLA